MISALIVAFCFCCKVLIAECQGDVFLFSESNWTLLHNYKLSLIQYSANWCPYSSQLVPIFEAVARQFQEETKKATIIFGKVDCDSNAKLCASANIVKYPTIRILKHGVMMKREYRGIRQEKPLVQFVRDVLVENITDLDGQGRSVLEVVHKLPSSKSVVVGVFTSNSSSNVHYQYFRMSGYLLNDNCAFYFLHNVTDPKDRLYYKEIETNEVHEYVYPESANFKTVYSWILHLCTPIVREITFANAEEITDEHLPLMLLFYNENSAHLKKKFLEFVKKHLMNETKSINFLTADGNVFSHPLIHVGKSAADLPLICLDSLAHMYLYSRRPSEALDDPTPLKEFIADFHSGKLHRELHYGHDLTVSKPKADSPQSLRGASDEVPASLPVSVFKDLQSSRSKYTKLIRDEL